MPECFYCLVKILKKNNKLITKSKKKFLKFVFKKNLSFLLIRQNFSHTDERVYYLLKIFLILIENKKLCSHELVLEYIHKYLSHQSFRVRLIVFKIMKMLKVRTIEKYFTVSYVKEIFDNLISPDEVTQKHAFKFIAELIVPFPSLSSIFVKQGIFKFLSLNISEKYNKLYFFYLVKFCCVAVEFCEENSYEFIQSRLYDVLDQMKYPQNLACYEAMFFLQSFNDYSLIELGISQINKFEFS